MVSNVISPADAFLSASALSKSVDGEEPVISSIAHLGVAISKDKIEHPVRLMERICVHGVTNGFRKEGNSRVPAQGMPREGDRCPVEAEFDVPRRLFEVLSDCCHHPLSCPA
jgi:hypothetical protein